jgi:AraC-like DNA-binding protein
MVRETQLNENVETRQPPPSSLAALNVPDAEAGKAGELLANAHHPAANQNLPAKIGEVPVAAGTTGAPETDALLSEKYRVLARHYLRSLPALFTKFTGLFSHVAWAPTWPHQWNARELPASSHLCREAMAGCEKTLIRCRSCAATHLSLAVKTSHKGHSFSCWLGVHNFWLPIIVRGYLVGLAFVQALAPTTAAGASQIPRAAHKPAARTTANAGRHTNHGGKSMSRSEFGEAARLLRLVVHHVETSALADLRKSDLSQAQQALLELQTVATRLRTELNGLVPAFNKTAPLLEPENHSERLVRAALEYIHTHFAQPFTLRQCARQLRLNAAYLSAQFSRAVGTPFKSYLTELRAEKARALLSDPTKTIAEVAYAVGYASPNRFRVAFKQTTGLSPRRWRETLRMEADDCG